MNAALEVSAAPTSESALARARVHRKLTPAEAARRAGLSEEAVLWLEEGRVYRFASTDGALLAMLLYTTALGIGHEEALALAGRPVPPKTLRTSSRSRFAALVAVALAGVALALVLALGRSDHPPGATTQAAGSPLPAPWAISVSVLNGSGDIEWTRQLASKIGALGYTIAKVGRANNFRYQQTAVYYPPSGTAIALRLARKLGVGIAPLPGGTDPHKLVVIAGPARVIGN